MRVPVSGTSTFHCIGSDREKSSGSILVSQIIGSMVYMEKKVRCSVGEDTGR